VLAHEPQLPDVESESILRVSRLLEPLLQEGFDSFLRRWSLDGGHAGVQPALISTSGGRLASFTRRLVLAIAHLSKWRFGLRVRRRSRPGVGIRSARLT